jgi:FixJ family two-component response regulator
LCADYATILDQTDSPILALVDDDPAVRQSLTFAFETAGISVSAFSDAESALASPDRLAWRCMVLDQRLPGISGLELLDRLRAAGVRAPSILITTHPSYETRTRARAAGVEIVEKPLLDNQLSKRVSEFIAGVG